MARDIAVITGSRADYGLLKPLMAMLRDDPQTHLRVIVTGMHLHPRFGATVQTIEADGFIINAKVEMPLEEDSPTAVAHAMGAGLPGISEVLGHMNPEILVILGDRYEMFCAAQAAMLMNIPIAHIHGGESSEGTMDEAIRHAITKLSHLHFTAAEPYRQRVIQMGEHPSRVWNVGALGLDTIRTLPWMSLEHLEAAIAFPLGEHFFLVTYHPVTLTQDDPEAPIRELLDALSAFPHFKILFTGVNADPGHAAIAEEITRYCARHTNRAIQVQSLGQVRYLSAMNHCAAVVGNSSSGILEAPAMKIPTVNIGARQLGRLRAPSVLDCDESSQSIQNALHHALSSPFKAMVKKSGHPFGDGHSAEKIVEILKSHQTEGLLLKKFFDFPASGKGIDHPPMEIKH
ncbi:MAG: neuC [Magnetococcales bacterium]|nr:neuC [Magnetococcales bacterium]